MYSFFDYYNRYEIPTFILCNPSKEELFALGTIYDRKYSPRYNSLGFISFTAPYKVDGVVQSYYSYLTYRRLIYLPNIGYFIITEVSEKDNGIVREKSIVAHSLEADLSTKKLSVFKGTYKFYDVVTPSTSLLGKILTYLPGWSVGTVSAALATLYRSFDISDATIYNFLMNDVETAYQCIFSFNSIAKTISAYTITEATTNTDIYLSYKNLINNVEIKEITDELVTALNVFGGGNLSISTVNPLGNDTIYNFSYYKTTAWMSQSLIDAITAWEAKVVLNQIPYAALLTSLRTANSDLAVLNAELATLESELTALENVLATMIAGRITGSAYTNQQNLVVAKLNAVNIKTQEVAGKTAQIAGITSQLTAINTAVSITNIANFTLIQQSELSGFIIGSTYQNDNFIQTDIMTPVEIQDKAQELYNQAISVLAKTSQPRYEFSADAVNFVFLKEFQTFIDQLVLGAIINLEIYENTISYPVLLGMDLNYDTPTDFKLIFGNRLRLDSSDFIFSDLFGQTSKSAVNSSFNSETWSNFNDNYRDDVSLFINSSLNAAVNNVISGSYQNILIDQSGMRGRQYTSTSSSGSMSYDPKQFWFVNNMLAFTKDSWNTASLALGEITAPDGSKTYGLVADTIVGRMVASNTLLVTNTNNSFRVDASGATLTDASLTVTSGNSRTIINPSSGIQISKYEGYSWIPKFYADGAGNITFAGALSGATGTFSGVLSAATGTFNGSITANSGTIGGWTINSSGISSGANYYINSNGYIKLGMLTMTPSTATFNGTIYAANLGDYIPDSKFNTNSINGDKILDGTLSSLKIGTISADSITTGTMTADRINGGTLRWGDHMRIWGDEGNYTIYIRAYAAIQLLWGNNNRWLNMTNNETYLRCQGLIISTPSSYTNFLNDVYFTGYIYAGAVRGLSKTTALRNSGGGTTTLTFYNGILTNSADG